MFDVEDGEGGDEQNRPGPSGHRPSHEQTIIGPCRTVAIIGQNQEEHTAEPDPHAPAGVAKSEPCEEPSGRE